MLQGGSHRGSFGSIYGGPVRGSAFQILPGGWEAKQRVLRVVLGGSWLVISGVLSPLIWVISIVTLLITLSITTREPPSKALGLRV